MAEIPHPKKRACCLLLRELSQGTADLSDPDIAANALATISQRCQLMQLVGQSRVKIDLKRSDCRLAISPEASQITIDEIAKTIAVNPELASHYDLLTKLNGILANNTKIQQLSERLRFYLAQAREGERRFGRVPETPLLDENKQSHNLSAGDTLQAHPLLNKPQFDGIAPKSTNNPVINTDAAKNAEELQHRLQNRPQPAFNPRPKMPGQG